jgi:hypothetical protein
MSSTNENGEMILLNNGIWTNTTHNIPELIGQYIKLWLEDNEPTEILTEMVKTKGLYSTTKQKETVNKVYGQLISDRISEVEIMVNKSELQSL